MGLNYVNILNYDFDIYCSLAQFPLIKKYFTSNNYDFNETFYIEDAKISCIKSC